MIATKGVTEKNTNKPEIPGKAIISFCHTSSKKYHTENRVVITTVIEFVKSKMRY